MNESMKTWVKENLNLSSSIDWAELLRQAYEVALQSPDPSTQNGALLVDLNGKVLNQDCNRFPTGVKYLPERWERPLKYKVIEHAERNVIYGAGRSGIATEGRIMVCPWAACSDCARGIIQSGVSALVTHKQAHDKSPPFWQEEIDIAFQMLREADVHIMIYDGKLGFEKEVLHSGAKWNP